MSVSINIWRLGEQMDKYRNALRKVLRAKFDDADPDIEVVPLVGRLPESPPSKEREDVLRSINGRILTYDTLIDETVEAYRDYLDADDRVTRIDGVLQKLAAEVEEAAAGEDSLDDGDEPVTEAVAKESSGVSVRGRLVRGGIDGP